MFRIYSSFRQCSNVLRAVGRFNIGTNALVEMLIKPQYSNTKTFSTSSCNFDLMEFFDDPKNWGESEVRSGRSWRKDELRIKSNIDLHKLWYVLLKEKNMLLTMEHAAKEEAEYFPNPERRDKVEESMKNLEEVVRERNKAYHELEIGETGERPYDYKEDEFARYNYVPLDEHLIPMHQNKKYLEEDLFPVMETVNPTVPEFHVLLKEKERLKERFERRQRKKYVKGLLERFPNLDMVALREQYPDIDVDQIKKDLE